MSVALGPGVFTITIGTAGTPVDHSCLVNSMTLTTDVSVGDSTFKLCGTEIPGTLTPTGTLAGNVDQDIDAGVGGGLFQACSEHWGETAAFTFEPSTSAGLEASGSVLLTPLTFGGDEYGAPLVSDFSFQTVGDILYKQGATLTWTQTMAPKAGVAAAGTSVAAAASEADEPAA
jgi:hypothetical protein